MAYPITTQKTTKHRVPHLKDPEHPLTGVLEQLEPDAPTQGRKIALLCHGTIGHKDYLFLKRLSLRLPIDSFRFDFRGNFESPGPWKQSGFEDDVDDINAAVAYLTSKFGYVIDMVVGHSRGSVAAARWMCVSTEGQGVRAFVNASGRYRMRLLYQTLSEEQRHELDTQGYFIRHETVARQPWSASITKEDMEAFANFDSSLVWDQFPKETHVLTMHGLRDQMVPPYDAIIYARIFGARNPGTHQLCYIEEADHNFTGLQDDVVATILEWLTLVHNGTVTTGIWQTGVRPQEQDHSSKL